MTNFTERPLLDFQRVMQTALEDVRAMGLPIRDDAELYRLACALLAHDVVQLRTAIDNHRQES